MRLYQVISTAIDHEVAVEYESSGFGSRAAAERFATGLAAAGKCISCDIESYDDDSEES